MKNQLKVPLEQIGIVCACAESFDTTWTVRHQVITRLANRYWTIWLEPAHNWRQIANNLTWPRSIQEPGYSGLLRYFPGCLPVFYKPKLLGEFFDALRLQHAAKQLRKKGCKKIYLYLWRPEFSAYSKLDCFDRLIYHIDDEYTFSNLETETPQEERDLIEMADHVMIHSPAMIEKKGNLNPNTSWIPNGVDFNTFSSPACEPSDLKSIPHPRVGYVGIIKKQLDFKILQLLAIARPNVSFVLVGPRGVLKSDTHLLNQLVALPNVYELGGKKQDAIGGYMQHMDLLVMCYKNDDYTKYIYPLKLHEYLATGRPVVSTPIRTVQSFSNVVMLASTVDEWLIAVDSGLSPCANESSKVRERKSTAKEFDWEELVERIARIIADMN